jgi:hypothetical protein
MGTKADPDAGVLPVLTEASDLAEVQSHLK